jgi:hypothetical protein
MPRNTIASLCNSPSASEASGVGLWNARARSKALPILLCDNFVVASKPRLQYASTRTCTSVRVARKGNNRTLPYYVPNKLTNRVKESNDLGVLYGNTPTMLEVLQFVLWAPLLVLAVLLIGSYSLFERVSNEEKARRKALADIPFDELFTLEYSAATGTRADRRNVLQPVPRPVHAWLSFLSVKKEQKLWAKLRLAMLLAYARLVLGSAARLHERLYSEAAALLQGLEARPHCPRPPPRSFA